MKKTINITPSWEAIMCSCFNLLNSGLCNESDKKIIFKEMKKCGQIADQYIDLLEQKCKQQP